MHYPLDSKVKTLADIPYTISFVIRKRMQLDGISEAPKEKRPSDVMIWDGTSEDIEKWFNDIYKGKNSENTELIISDDEIER